MAPFLKISLDDRIILGLFGAEGEALELVVWFHVVGDAVVAGVALELLRPLGNPLGAATLTNLLVSNVVGLVDRGHWRVVGVAHEILS